MIQRIAEMTVLPDHTLKVLFDDGKRVVYDVKTDMDLPGFDMLWRIPGLFQSAQIDESRTCVFWNDEIDIPSDAVYEFGKEIPGNE